MRALPAALAAALAALTACEPLEPSEATPDTLPDPLTDATPDTLPDAPDATPDATPDTLPLDPDAPYTLYLDPAGDDTRDGLTPATALLTLARAHQLIEATDPDRDVEIRIAPGRYHLQQVIWTRTHPNHALRLRPTDPAQRPIFDGCGPGGDLCPGGAFFQLVHADGEDTGIDIEGIRVENYQRAIYLYGDREDPAAYNRGNRVADCVFFNIGNIYNLAVGNAFGAVTLVNSRDNVITGNRFERVLNYFEYGLLHGVYLAHHSHGNLVEANTFISVSGDPVRVRDFSNDNVIRDNAFQKTGAAALGDWYCENDTRDDCTKITPECPSWNTHLEGNLFDGTWSLCDPLPAAMAYQDDTETGCTPPPDAERYRLVDNQTADPSACQPGIDPVDPPMPDDP